MDQQDYHKLSEKAPIAAGVAHDKSRHAGRADRRKAGIERICPFSALRGDRQHQKQGTYKDYYKKAECQNRGGARSSLFKYPIFKRYFHIFSKTRCISAPLPYP